MVLEIAIEELVAERSPLPEDAPKVSRPSGLTYYDIKPGDGPTPAQDAHVRIALTGWLEDDSVFFSTHFQHKPIDLTMDRIEPKGLREGVATMQVGGVRRIVVPPDLGYGDREIGMIPSNATLTYEAQLVAIAPKPVRRPPQRETPKVSQPGSSLPREVRRGQPEHTEGGTPPANNQETQDNHREDEGMPELPNTL
jgi:peptidylprolyl isomerase